jgi:polysaccharide export outer membrane protein
MCVLLCACVTGRAQESLLIGPGDELTISFFDAPELNQTGRVSDSGEFPLLMGGNIKLAGLTPDRASAAIASFMVSAHYLVNPRVSVVVTTFATQNVSVLGDVRLPGAYPITTGRTISEVLALAGGLMPDADHNVVVQRRVTGELLSFYSANSPLTRPDTSSPGIKTPGSTPQLQSRDVLVYPGDTVRVAHSELVYILGDVGKPGGYPIVNNDQNLTILQLVSLAGATPPSAWPSKSRLIRKRPDGGYDDLHIQLSNMQKGKEADRPLQAGDIVYVPFSYIKNAFLGVGGLVISASTASIYRIP